MAEPSCYRVEGVMEAYRHTLEKVTLHGPTHFAPVIDYVAK